MYNSVEDWSKVVHFEKIRKQMAKKLRRFARKNCSEPIENEEEAAMIMRELEVLVQGYHRFLNTVCHKHRSHSETLDNQIKTLINLVDNLCPSTQISHSERTPNVRVKPVLPNGIHFKALLFSTKFVGLLIITLKL